MTTKNNVTEVGGLKVVVTRVVNAPCELVYRAWTVPEQMAQWYSPKEVECRSVPADVRTGGEFRIHMVSPKGDHIAIGTYTEVIAGKRLQFTWQWENYAMPDSRITVDFEDLGKTTRLTLTHTGFPDQEDADDHKRGWTSFMEKFGEWIDQDKSQPK